MHRKTDQTVTAWGLTTQEVHCKVLRIEDSSAVELEITGPQDMSIIPSELIGKGQVETAEKGENKVLTREKGQGTRFKTP